MQITQADISMLEAIKAFLDGLDAATFTNVPPQAYNALAGFLERSKAEILHEGTRATFSAPSAWSASPAGFGQAVAMAWHTSPPPMPSSSINGARIF
jgi:hypothetical protein